MTGPGPGDTAARRNVQGQAPAPAADLLSPCEGEGRAGAAAAQGGGLAAAAPALTESEARRLAALMAAAFTERERGWSAAELRDLAGQPGVILESSEQGFGLARVVGTEAEILTLAVHPGARRRGQGAQLLDRLTEAVRARGAERLFLEVAEGNAPARRLYATRGFAEAGRRRGYSRRADGGREDALILERRIGEALARRGPRA